MSHAITTRGLGKRYRRGGQHGAYRTLREDIVRLVRSPWRGRSKRSPDEWFWALRDVGLEVTAGEIVGVVGVNGAGKSTLLKILARITKPTEGRATLRGRVGSLLEVGTGFHPELTGRENTFLAGAILGMRRLEIASKFDEIVAFAEIESFVDTPVKHFSSGMYTRLAFAVAAHLEPEILLVDEVLAVGDVAFQRKCLGKMTEVAQGGRTVLFVSHNMDAIERICPRAVLFAGGQMVLDGPSREVVQSYLGRLASHSAPVRSSAAGPERFSNIEVQVDGCVPDGPVVWKVGDEITLHIHVLAARPASLPAVDVAFYTDRGQRLFAVSSDRASLNAAADERRQRWTLRLELEAPRTLAGGVYCDLGVRESVGSPYVLLWNRAVEFDIPAHPDAACFTEGSLIWTPARLQVAAEPSGTAAP